MQAPDSDSQPAVTTENALGQPIGFPLFDWTPPPFPPREALQGRYCRLEPLDPDRHAAELHAANQLDTTQRIWTYLAYGPFDTLAAYRDWMQGICRAHDLLFFAI